VAVVIPALFLLLIELLVRWIGVARPGEDLRGLPIWVQANVRDRAFVPDARLFWRVKPASDWLKTNSLGLHGEEIPRRKDADTYRILCLGDSITWGFPLHYTRAYPYLLERLLDRLPVPLDFEVLNAGVPGYSSLQGRRYLEELLPLGPDCITVMFGRNDQRQLREEGGVLPDRQVPILPGWVIALRRLLGHSRLYGFLRSVLVERQDVTAAERAQLDPRSLRVRPSEFRENIRAIVEMARERGIAVVLITTARTPPPMPHYNRVLREMAESEGLPLADVARAFERRGVAELVVDDCHPNERGHRLIAQELAVTLARQVIPLAESIRPADLSYPGLEPRGESEAPCALLRLTAP